MPFVQTVEGNSTGNNISATTGNITTTSGNFVILVGGSQTASNDVLPSDSYGNTWHIAKHQTDINGNRDLTIFYAYNIIGGGAHNFSLSSAGGVRTTCVAQEFSGLMQVLDPFDQSAGAKSPTDSGPTGMTIQEYELIVAATYAQNNISTVGSGFSNLDFGNNSTFSHYTIVESQEVSSKGTYNGLFVDTGNPISNTIAATFRLVLPRTTPSIPSSSVQNNQLSVNIKTYH